MSALARILAAQGVRVTGSDIKDTPLIESLRAEGIRVTIGHSAGNLGSAEVVAYSTAIRPDNPELAEARRRGLVIHHRSEVLQAIVRDHETIAVTGTHGKTTTTAMLGVVLVDAGLDPTVLVGGMVPDLGGNARPGKGRHAVVEADESDRSFRNLTPAHATITNIEPDHLDQYGSFEAIKEAFSEFASSVPDSGLRAFGADCPTARSLAAQLGANTTFGLSADAAYRASHVSISLDGSSFIAHGPSGRLGAVRLRLPGEHYVRNALGALAAAVQLGVAPDTAIAALERFRGTERRFERLGVFRGATVVDDYAHHPTEVRATIHAAKRIVPGRLVAAFQPHLYSRTHYLMDEFAGAFEEADLVVLTDIYAAREDPDGRTTGAALAERVMQRRGDGSVAYVPSIADLPAWLEKAVLPGDTILLMGAGDIRDVSEDLVRIGATQDGRTV